ncbi:MAG: 4Fe-4S binding protein [Chloroflexi bacterium]|nr:4Fe-4S binding protein [Chloroflexota bacterium]
MCEYCVKHGEGQKWYLQAKNYSDDLLSDLQRRKFIEDFFTHPESLEDDAKQLERLDRAPGFVRRVVRWRTTSRMKKIHFGQVLPIEDVERIFDFATSIVRVACICRQAVLGSEQRYCYGVSMAPDGGRLGEIIRAIDASYLTGPDTAGLESLSKEEALAAFRQHEREGLCHTVWTFVAPFIGGICNCDRSDCMAMRSTVTHGVPVMFRAEYVAQVDRELCNGCRACMRACQFGAVSYSAAQNKALIDPRRCYGCGVCRSLCAKNAILLPDRSTVRAAANVW